MMPRAWAAAGLVTGVVTGLALLAAVMLSPDPRLTPLPTGTPRASVDPSGTAESTSPSIATSASPAATPSPVGSGATVMHIGERAPILALQLAPGGFLDLSERRGRPIWVWFMTAGCAACADQVPQVNDFTARYAADGLQVLAVDARDDAGAASAWVKRTGATFPVLLDLDGGAARAWGVSSYPSHFWIDATGVIRDAAQGPATVELMVHGLTQILPGVTVAP